MQSSSDLIPEPLPGERGDQGHRNNGAGRKNDGGPGKEQRKRKKMPDQQFNEDAQRSNAHKNIERHGKERRRYMAVQRCGKDGEHGDADRDGKGEFKKPLRRRRVERNEIFIQTDSQAVQRREK